MLPVQDEEDMEKTIEICHCCNCPEINCQVQSRKQGTEPINHNAFSVGLCGIQGVLHHRQPQKKLCNQIKRRRDGQETISGVLWHNRLPNQAALNLDLTRGSLL